MSGKELAKNLAFDFSLEKLRDFFFHKGFTVKDRETFIELSGSNREIVESIKLVATKDLEDTRSFSIYAIKLNQDITERSSKKRQFQIAKDVLKAESLSAGIFVFYTDEKKPFRFSLVFKESYGTKAEYSPYKRYTYYVSPHLTNKTFIDQVGNADFSSLKSVKSAFSVSPVTKEFYKEIQNWYFWAMDKVWFPEDYKHSEDPQKDEEIRIATNLIRLITRLMFVWFLKEKGLVPEDLFDKERLRGIVKDFGKGNNYYNAILQNLFFAVLNQKIEDRRFAKDDGFFANRNEYGVKTLLRYKDKFLISEEEVLELFGQIPFINGGLFDCLDKEDENGRVIYVDGFSRNPEKQAKVPDYLFFQEKEERVDLSKYGLGKREPVRGLIEILKSYNFTVDEATPIDQEIALDPEMLGKVFENLLAAYVPETAETARKATGSYYTPREIVDYMVDESLKEYFKTHSKLTEEQIEKLLSYTEDTPELTEDQRHEIIELIDRLKVLDPACGSGAFLMGILHKLVHILQKIDPNNELWYKLQFQRAIRESKEAFKKLELDKSEREEILKEINESFDESLNYPDYARKLYLIENCIYGVDIQPIAVQISKLRFFISLLIDQKVDKSKENFGIRPLPNLETNFVAANTLIGLEGNNHIWRTQEIKDLEEQIKRVRHRYFNAKTRKQKLELQKKDKELREKLKEKLEKAKLPAETAEKIAKFDPYDQNASSDWFDPEWMFGVTDGFDIVIGNPPHGARIEDYKMRILGKFKFYETRKNSASLFIEQGFHLLKELGVLSFIIPKSFTYVKSWEKPRVFSVFHNRLLSVIDVSKAFENVKLEQVIVICKKEKINEDYFFKTGDYWGDSVNYITLSNTNLIKKLGIIPVYIDELKFAIYNKIIKDTVLLNQISYTCRGLPFQKYITPDGDIEVIRGDNIGKFTIYGDIKKISIPKMDEQNKKKLNLLRKQKIISQNIVAHAMKPFDRIIIIATFDNIGYLTLDTVMNTFIYDISTYSYNYILGILNSRLAEWFYYWFVYNRAIRTMHFDEYYIGKLPVKKVNFKNFEIIKTLESLVDQILSIKKQNPDEDTSHLEKQIDQLVYKLYDLTEEEIKIIESS